MKCQIEGCENEVGHKVSRPRPKPFEGMTHIYVCDKHLERFTDEDSKKNGYSISEPEPDILVINTFIEKCVTYNEAVTRKYNACMHPGGNITRLRRYDDPIDYEDSSEWMECHYCGFETGNSEEMIDHIKMHLEEGDDWMDF